MTKSHLPYSPEFRRQAASDDRPLKHVEAVLPLKDLAGEHIERGPEHPRR